MRTITFANLKGGCGKTSLTCLLGLHWAEVGGLEVAVLDRDPQQSARAVVQHQAHPRLRLWTGPNGHSPDLLLVDTPPGLAAEELRRVVAAADALVVPLKPMPTDVISTRQLARLLGPGARARLVFNMVDGRTTACHHRSDLALQVGWPPLEAFLSQRVAYGYALEQGLSALPPPARAELAALAAEVRALAG